MTLEQFEALVLSQRPATKPWTPTTAVPYDFESRKQAEGKHPDLIVEVFQPSRVLDVGCGPGHLLALLRERGVPGQGLDIAASAIWVDAPITRFDIGECREEFWEASHWRADVVICREVLEHLTIRQIRQAVTNLCTLSSRFVYLTTRFAKAPTSLLDVDTSDDLDPTHMSMLNQDFLRVLFVLEGFKRRADLEQRMDWLQKGRVLVYERAA